MHIGFLAKKDLCFTGNVNDFTIKMEKCDELALNQKWQFATMNLTALQNWDKSGKQVKKSLYY